MDRQTYRSMMVILSANMVAQGSRFLVYYKENASGTRLVNYLNMF